MEIPDTTQKIVPRRELARRSEEMRAHGKRLVLTNGCFDLLHVGHVRYLHAARALGEALAVGLNGDASVHRLKGDGRPLTTANERAEVLAALEDIDFVTIFEEDNATELAADVQPAIYVKGGDYSSDPADPNFPIEGGVVMRNGGIVRIVDYVPDRSTTRIIDCMRR